MEEHHITSARERMEMHADILRNELSRIASDAVDSYGQYHPVDQYTFNYSNAANRRLSKIECEIGILLNVGIERLRVDPQSEFNKLADRYG